MSETLTAYFSSRTGHVLGAVTRAAGAIPSPPRAASLEDVLVRGGYEGPDPSSGGSVDPSFPGFLVPARELSTLVLAPDPRLLPAPLKFQVPVQTDVVQPLRLHVEEISLTFIPATGSATVKVTVVNPVTQAEPVLVLIAGGALTEPRIAVGAILASGREVSIDLANLPAATYHALALVRGHLPFAAKVSSP